MSNQKTTALPELTFAEFGQTFKEFQKLHPDYPWMIATFNAWSGNNPNVGIYYSDGTSKPSCYTSSYYYDSVESLHKMMKKELKEVK